MDITNEEILALLDEYNCVAYDPDKHLIASVAADHWHVLPRTATEMLREIARKNGLDYIDVRLPSGKRVKAIAFK